MTTEKIYQKYKSAMEFIDELEDTATRLRGLVEAVNKYKKSRLITDRKAMFELAKELKDG